MNKIIRFTKREYIAAVKTKGFIIGLIIAPIMMSGGFLAFLLLKDRVDTTDKHIAVIDHTGVVAQALVEAAAARNENEIFDEVSGQKIKPAYYIEIVKPNDLDTLQQHLELSDRVRKGELHAFMVIGPNVVHPGEKKVGDYISYYGKNAAMDDVRRWTSWPINNHLRKLRLADAGIEESQVPELFDWIDVGGLGLVSVDESTGDIADAREASPIEALVVPIAFMMLMFLMIMMSVPNMLNSVMEEKTQRIAEVMLGSVTPFQFMSAKLLSGIAVSLTSSAVYLLGGLFVLSSLSLQGYIPFHVLPWFLVYMLLAILMFGAMSASLGATCNEAKDAQSLTFPMILPALIPMLIYFPIAKEPMSSFSTWVSLIPPFTPMLMTLRMATPDSIPMWQPFVGLVGVILFTVLFVWAGGRIFRVAILMQGTPPKFANIIKWAIRG
jgi:ABC-2 type transport system permease protein